MVLISTHFTIANLKSTILTLHMSLVGLIYRPGNASCLLFLEESLLNIFYDSLPVIGFFIFLLLGLITSQVP